MGDIEEGTPVWNWILKNKKVEDKWIYAKECLRETERILRGEGEPYENLKTLVEITNNGFYEVTDFFVCQEKNGSLKTKIEEVFNEFWQHLWQARDLVDYMTMKEDSTVYQFSQAIRHLDLRFPGDQILQTLGMELFDKSVIEQDPDALMEYYFSQNPEC